MELMDWFKNQKGLHRKYAYMVGLTFVFVNFFTFNVYILSSKLYTDLFSPQILLQVRKYMISQPTLVDVKIPEDSEFTVCGDIHGQYYDLMNIFKINGLPSESNPYVSNHNHKRSMQVLFCLYLFNFYYVACSVVFIFLLYFAIVDTNSCSMVTLWTGDLSLSNAF